MSDGDLQAVLAPHVHCQLTVPPLCWDSSLACLELFPCSVAVAQTSLAGTLCEFLEEVAVPYSSCVLAFTLLWAPSWSRVPVTLDLWRTTGRWCRHSPSLPLPHPALSPLQAYDMNLESRCQLLCVTKGISRGPFQHLETELSAVAAP